MNKSSDIDSILKPEKLSDTDLIHENALDPARKIFQYDNFILKIRFKEKDLTQHLRINNLKEEYEILLKCRGLRGIPNVEKYYDESTYEAILMERIPGSEIIIANTGFGNYMRIFAKLSKIVFLLSLRGIVHNDLKPDNILVNEKKEVFLLDFDQAIITNPFTALLRQFFLIKIGKTELLLSLPENLKLYLKRRHPRLTNFLKKYLKKNDNRFARLPDRNTLKTGKLISLHNAWEIAQNSDASSPGELVAYYSLNFSGVTFPGERPWLNRWNILKNITDYSNKTIIELGCNMGLLSTFLLKEKKAKKVIGVDVDPNILKAAEIISGVFEVKPHFEQMNFDTTIDWERKLLSFNADIVFALNVLNWVKDKPRLLKFLSNFNSVIFEGHDDIRTEKERFRKMNFNVREIGYSERGRMILFCTLSQKNNS
jgi:predicted Ser/Thr protein kinase